MSSKNTITLTGKIDSSKIKIRKRNIKKNIELQISRTVPTSC